MLRAFDKRLSPEAKSKLTLDALVPPPPDVVNQRYEPIFDKYLITGKTYTTASGTVVPNELQYYDGEMVQFYGECTNVPAVNEVLAGSGYKAMTLTYPGGRQTAVAQLWSSRFTDTSIRPYSAMFIVVIVVPDDAPQTRRRSRPTLMARRACSRCSTDRSTRQQRVREQGTLVPCPASRYHSGRD